MARPKQILIPSKLQERTDYLQGKMLEVSGIDIFDTSRLWINAIARAMVAKILLSEGYTQEQVGCVLNRCHATINYYKNVMIERLGTPGFDAERELWTKFTNAI